MNTLSVAAGALARSRDKATSILTVLAIALPHAVMLAVIGGVMMFQAREAAPTNDFMVNGPHVTLAFFAATMLIVPALSMGAAAARLGLSRKARTLATLRLIGITPAHARGAAMIDTLFHAVIGVLLGSVLYAVTLPAWSLLTFQDSPIATTELWIGAPALLVSGVAMISLSALSSFFAMQRVAITPLGVVRQSERAKVNTAGVILAFVVMVVWFASSPFIGHFGVMFALTVMLGFMAAMIALMNVLGVASVTVLGRIIARVSPSAAGTLAGRRIASDPKAVWRSFGALGLVAFIVGLLLPIIDIIMTVSVEGAIDEFSRVVLADVNTGLLVTLGISILLAAISTAVQQAIRAIDSGAQRQALADMGAPRSYWVKARRREVGYPAFAIIGGAVLIGLLFISPVAASGSALVPLAAVLMSTLVALVVVLAAAETARLLER